MENDGIKEAIPAGKNNAPSTPREQLAQQIVTKDGAQGGIYAQLTNNPFFTAVSNIGFGLAALGTGLSFAQKGARHGAALLRRRLLVDVEITRHDESYQWFLQWMTHYQRSQLLESNAPSKDQGLLSRLARRLTPGLHHLSMQTTSVRQPNGATHTNFALVPGPGNHILRYGPAFIAVSRERDKGPLDPTGKPFETVKLTTLYAHRHIFQDLFSDAYALSQSEQEGKTTVYTSWMTDWRPLGEPKRKRPLESVVLEKGVKERIVEDIQAFIGAREWYLDRGIPYRRGYLLYGQPGTGKSSFIQALAGHLDFNIAMLNLSERGLTDDRLMHLMINVPPRTVVVLEDADAAFSNRRTQSDDDGYRGANVTFSGLLNALDGVASAEERIVFLTTNHVERLDKALVRPGRVDMTVHMGAATEWQVQQLWDRFFKDLDPESQAGKIFVEKFKSHGLLGEVSTAALQGHFLFNKGDPSGAIQTLDHLAGQPATMEPAAG
ncbi:MAG: hypothetical protein M1831_005560 [Alyxoria varia]|nr:MAG: hypothetical protein M1831_005560 [Alyxoria varia]